MPLTVARYLFLLLLPAALAAALHYATVSDQVARYQQAHEVVPDLVSNSPTRVRHALAQLDEPLARAARWRLTWLPRLAILLGMVSTVLVIPQGATPRRAVNLLTTAWIGFGLVRLGGGFLHLPWDEMALTLLLGTGLALVVLILRRDREAA